MNPFKERMLLTVAPVIGYGYIRLLRGTMQLSYRGREVLEQARRETRNYILAFWHSRFVLMPYGYPDKRIVVLSGYHRDAEAMVRILRRFGFASARGSTTAGGTGGMRALIRKVNLGYDVGMTPDGPRGPRRRVQPGVIATARLTGLPIIPVTFSAIPATRLRSWDRTLMPKFFSKGLFLYGDPIRVPREADEAEQERQRASLEAELDRITDLADQETGIGSEDPRPAPTAT